MIYQKVRRLIKAKTGHGYIVETKHADGSISTKDLKISDTNMRAKGSSWRFEGLTLSNTWIPIDEVIFISWKPL